MNGSKRNLYNITLLSYIEYDIYKLYYSLILTYEPYDILLLF